MEPGFEPSFGDIERAAGRIRGAVADTFFHRSRTLSEILGCELWLKHENLQYTASFKERGALNKLSQLDEAERARGVVAMSAGNHAQGVAYHAARLGIAATIVMPAATPFMKIENTVKLGAEVRLEGEGVDEAARFAHALQDERGLVFVPPFDDADVIAGQGTIALEILRDRPDLDILVVPIGGGGLVSGIAVAAKAIKPDIEIVGVQAELCPSIACARSSERVVMSTPTIAEGIAVKVPGTLTLRIIDALVDEVVCVREAALEAAILRLLEIEKTVVEGAGAAGLAAIASFPERFAGRRVATVLCGGNIDSRLLSAVILRGLVRSQRLVRFRLSVPDVPGKLAELTAAIAGAGGNIIEIAHNRAFSRMAAKLTDVEFTVESRNGDHAAEIARMLEGRGLEVHTLDP